MASSLRLRQFCAANLFFPACGCPSGVWLDQGRSLDRQEPPGTPPRACWRSAGQRRGCTWHGPEAHRDSSPCLPTLARRRHWKAPPWYLCGEVLQTAGWRKQVMSSCGHATHSHSDQRVTMLWCSPQCLSRGVNPHHCCNRLLHTHPHSMSWMKMTSRRSLGRGGVSYCVNMYNKPFFTLFNLVGNGFKIWFMIICRDLD